MTRADFRGATISTGLARRASTVNDVSFLISSTCRISKFISARPAVVLNSATSYCPGGSRRELRAADPKATPPQLGWPPQPPMRSR
jgi:hypothetical protein